MSRISLITICYNNKEDIGYTINSVCNQVFKDFEYIIVDGGSSDGTLDVILENCTHPYKLISEKDNGLYDAINKGLKIAQGEIVGLIHAGDALFDCNVLRDIYRFFEAKPDTDIIYGHSIILKDRIVPVRVNKSPAFRKANIRKGWMPSHQSIYMKRHLLESFGYYNLALHPSSDYEFFIRYFYKANLKIRLLDRFIVRFSIGGRSTKNYLNNLKAQPQHKLCWTVNGEAPPKFLIPLKLGRKPKQFLLGYYYRFFKNGK
jgi:glycosyltransferase involved in cell wall biosynthesis